MTFLLFLASTLLFLLFQSASVFGGDSGDLVTAAVTFGVPHPPGYPFYTFLGWLTSHLPAISPAWGVSLWSSIPHAVTVVLIFQMVILITGSAFAALFAVVVIAGNYIFFLYSVTPEVFAMLDFFVVFVLYLACKLVQTKRLSYWYWLVFVFGLSLTHHHMIVFLVPAVAYFLWSSREVFWKKIRWVKTAACFAAGLIPYFYVVAAARGTSMILWDKPDTIARFVRLVTRGDYGTFQSSPVIGNMILQRLIAIQSYIQFVFLDFTWIGVVLALLGLWFVWKRSRHLFAALVIGIVSLGPLFFFYASFPFINRFTIGTYERFLLPSYLLISILVGAGLAQLIHYLSYKVRPVVVWGVVLVLSFYPLAMGGVTLWRFAGVQKDRTAEYLGRDILESLPPNSILLLGRDTIIFSVQYARYVLGVRPDIIAIHMSRIDLPEYRQMLGKHFPSVGLPQEKDNFTRALIRQNIARFRIFSYMPVDIPGETMYWIPYGLVYELVPSAVPIDDVVKTNEALWARFHDPTAGILARYPHLLLSDVRDVYADGRMALGKPLLASGKSKEAISQFASAVRLAGDSTTADASTYLGLALLAQKECDHALASFTRARRASVVPDVYLTFYEGITYRDCVKDSARAEKLFSEFDTIRISQHMPLKEL